MDEPENQGVNGNEGPDLAEVAGRLNDIYDDYRTLLLSRKYYGNRVHTYATHNKVFEIGIAVGTSSTGVAGFALWQTEYGRPIWGIISGVAIILSVIKPLMGYAVKIEQYASLHAEYATLFARMRQIVRDINSSRKKIATTGDLPQAIAEATERVRAKMVDLAPLEDRKPNTKLLLKLDDEVNHEIPVERLWVPS